MEEEMDCTLSLRVTQRLMKKINELAELCGLEASEIVRRAGRHIKRSEEDFGFIAEGFTAREPLEALLKVRNFPVVDMDADTMRTALEMCIDEGLERSRKYAPFRTDKREGKDYVVVEA